MNEKKFDILTDVDITNRIHEMVREGSKLKNEIFKSVIMMKDLDKKVIQLYLGYVNSFLKYWDEYSSTLQEEMKTSNGVEGVRSISYERVRDYVYAKNDYASVLEFVDGLIKLVESGKCESIEDIEDFMDHTLSKAFPSREAEVGGLEEAAIAALTGQDREDDNGENKEIDRYESYVNNDPKLAKLTEERVQTFAPIRRNKQRDRER